MLNISISTARLKLTLVTAAQRGDPEFEWIHELRSNVQSAWWSLYGPSKTLEDTEKALKNILPVSEQNGEEKIYRIAYTVHEIDNPGTNCSVQVQFDNGDQRQSHPSTFIGLITLRSLTTAETTFPPRLGHASTSTMLSLEIAYMFLPTAWNRGLATEAINAVFESCKNAPQTFWAPFEQVFVRAVVNGENVPSQRVMEKCGMSTPNIIEFEGGMFFIAGKWQEKHRLCIFGKRLV